jgi:hypothetical protein
MDRAHIRQRGSTHRSISRRDTPGRCLAPGMYCFAALLPYPVRVSCARRCAHRSGGAAVLKRLVRQQTSEPSNCRLSLRTPSPRPRRSPPAIPRASVERCSSDARMGPSVGRDARPRIDRRADDALGPPQPAHVPKAHWRLRSPAGVPLLFRQASWATQCQPREFIGHVHDGVTERDFDGQQLASG